MPGSLSHTGPGLAREEAASASASPLGDGALWVGNSQAGGKG